MRIRQFQKSCVITSGLLSIALGLNCSVCSVSHGQTVSATRAQGSFKLIETAAYIDLPSTVLDEETSPSDSGQKSNAAAQEANEPDEKDSASQKSAEGSSRVDSRSDVQPEKKSGESIAPMQNRELTIRVQAISISHDKIGTGLVPKSGSARSSEQIVLPTGNSRGIPYSHVNWRASNIQHFPLYFEDAMLERHGHTRSLLGFECAQTLVSGVKFFGTIPLLPYLKTLRPKHDCVYALGHYRPGSCAPCLRDNIPYDAKAAIVESASAAAFFWATPL